MKVLLINIGKLVTFEGNQPIAKDHANKLVSYENTRLLIEDGKIQAIGENLWAKDAEIIDCKGTLVTPGYVDSHTHFVFGGHRENEFRMRLEGESYEKIMQAGGGIAHSVTHTRKASAEELKKHAREVLLDMLAYGVTTVEGKSGYGLDLETELKQLRVMKELADESLPRIVRTFMGAHEIPPEYKGRNREYLDFLLKEVMPLVKAEDLADIVDIFTEKGVFSIEESLDYLKASREMGFEIKVHADEIHPLGGAQMAAQVGAISADHLLKISDEGIAALKEAGTIATLLPLTAFSLKADYAPARKMIEAELPVALATDFNPGSCHSYSIPLMIALASLQMQMNIEEILAGLTLNAAAAIGKEDEVGSLEVGKNADIIIHRVKELNFLPYLFGVNTVERVLVGGKTVYDQAIAYGK